MQNEETFKLMLRESSHEWVSFTGLNPRNYSIIDSKVPTREFSRDPIVAMTQMLAHVQDGGVMNPNSKQLAALDSGDILGMPTKRGLHCGLVMNQADNAPYVTTYQSKSQYVKIRDSGIWDLYIHPAFQLESLDDESPLTWTYTQS